MSPPAKPGAYLTELHEYVVEVEREVLAEELARLDVDLPAGGAL